MAKLLALEWDAREARVAVARTRGKEVVVEHAFAIDLTASDGGPDAGPRIAAALAARNVGRVETLVAVGRASIELQQMSLPPAPPEELPDMVRFQAMRQFTSIGDDWPLDFVPLQAAPGTEGLSVLAAAIAPDMVRQLEQACAAADLTPKRLVLRPFAAASLLCRHDRAAHQPPRLMVDLLTDEADLTVLVDEHVLLMRTVRLPAADESAGQIRALVGQMMRTIAAAQNQLRGERVEKIILCGDGSDQLALKELIAQQLPQTVEFFNPLDELRVSNSLARQLPEHPGRFAPLIGMLLDEAAGTGHAIDFLHPRKRPEPPSAKRRQALVAAATLVAAVSLFFVVWTQLAGLDEEIEALNLDVAARNGAVTKAEALRKDVQQVQQFLASDITWLDELYQISENIPPAEKVLVTQLTMSTRQPAGGQIVVDGYVRESDQLREVHAALRHGGRQVISTGGQDDTRREAYHWRFKETVLVPPRDPAERTAPVQEPPDDTSRTGGGPTHDAT